MTWIDKLPQDIRERLANCTSIKSDIEALVNIKYAFMLFDRVGDALTGRDAQRFTKEDVLVSVLELLDANGQTFDLTQDEYDSLKKE